MIQLQDSWASVLGILDVFAKNQDTFTAAAGPGHWNDPDMVRFVSSANLWSRLPEGCYISVVKTSGAY